MGSLACLVGILTLTLSVLVTGQPQADATLSIDTDASKKALRMMIKDAFLAMFLFGIRINMAKYCSRVLSAWTFARLNFYAEAGCALFVMILSGFGTIEVPFQLFYDPDTLIIALPAGIFCVLAEVFVILALNEGLTGPVSAMISFSVVFVSILTWSITGIALTWF